MSDLNVGKYSSLNQIPADVLPYLNIPSDFFQKQKQYQQQQASYESQKREAAEWAQAEKIAGAIQSGNPKRYDPQSSVGKKINAYLDNWALAKARKEGTIKTPPTHTYDKFGNITSIKLPTASKETTTIAYKSPFTTEIIYQSMTPEDASKKGLYPVVVDKKGKEVSGAVPQFVKPEYFSVGKTYAPKELTIDKYTPPTEKDIKFSEYAEAFYGGESGAIGKTWENVREKILVPISNIPSRIFPRKKQTPEQEMFTPKEISSEIGGTSTYDMKPTGELSPEAGYLRTAMQEEMFAPDYFKSLLEGKKSELEVKYSPGGITFEEAEKANRELSSFYETQKKTFLKEAEEREKKRQEKFFPKGWVEKNLPAWDFDPTKFEERTWMTTSKTFGTSGAFGVKAWEVKGVTELLSFGAGAYKGIREHPVKTAVTAGAFVVLPAAFKITGSVGKSLGVTKAVGGYGTTFTKVGSKTLTGLYGASVVGRIALTPGTYEKFGVGGEIFATELIPMYAGGKIGSYGLRRYELGANLRKIVKQMPPEDQITFKKLMSEAKTYRGVRTEVSELDLGRLKLLEGKPLAQKRLVKFFSGRSDIVVGGSVAQQSQMSKSIKTKRPGDIDIYFKGGEYKASALSKEIKNVLKISGIKEATTKGGKVLIGGEKLLEAHQFSTFLSPNIEQVLPLWRTWRAGITTTPSGIKILKLDVQWQRKLIGYYTEPYISGKFRMKDLPAASAIRKQFQLSKGDQLYPQLGSFMEREVFISPFSKTSSIGKFISSKKIKGNFLDEWAGRMSYPKYKAYKLGYKPIPLSNQFKNFYTPKTKPTSLFSFSYTPAKQSTTFYNPKPLTEQLPTLYKSKQSTTTYTPFVPKPIMSPLYKSKQSTTTYTPFVPKPIISQYQKVKPPKIPPFRIPFWLPGLGAGKKKSGRSYIPQVLDRGKWINVSAKTMTEVGALSRASKVADNTTSRRMRIIPKNIPPEDLTVGNYWGERKYKFRPYKIKQRRKYKLPISFIEKVSYAIDTPGEVRGLRAKNFAQSKGWLTLTRTRKKKRRSQWALGL